VISGADVDREPRLLFTAPWEPLVVRRGDALGLRALTDQFADVVAPDLSNRVRDGRWVTILAWCLARSHEVFDASGGRSLATCAEQRERYAWLRPLELMWVARTIALADDWRDRSLAGLRRVRPWYEDDNRSTDCFGMTEDQFRAYRQTGVYGGYRLAFRKWPGMTVPGDGWTPDPATLGLARWLDEKLGEARLSWPLGGGEGDVDSLSKRSAKLGVGEEHRRSTGENRRAGTHRSHGPRASRSEERWLRVVEGHTRPSLPCGLATFRCGERAFEERGAAAR